MTDLDRRLLAAFQIEYREHLEQIRKILAGLDGNGSAAVFEELLRRAHNLKGAARAVDLLPIERLAHGLETLFSRAGRQTLAIDPAIAAIIHEVVDGIEDWITTHLAGQTPGDLKALGDKLDRVLGVTSVPPVTAIAAPVAIEPLPSTADDSTRVTVAHVDRLLVSTGQVVAECQRQDLLTREVRILRQEVEAVVREWDHLRRRRPGAPPPDALDAQLRHLSRQTRRLERLQGDAARALQGHGRRLRQDVQRVMMVPARTVFEVFPKLMRDLARDLNKMVAFSMHGMEVEADRRVLQVLKDPLLHLLRNAVSHGLEPAAERTAGGKPESGQVTLSLTARGNRLRVRVEDDGRGVDFRRVAHLAHKRGLLAPTEVDAATPSELARFLFSPGFSTSNVITEISGRGIGLSVVHDAVTRLQGEVQLEAPPSGGTAFVLTVPLALSLQRLLLVLCADQTFGIPTAGVERLLRTPRTEVTTLQGRPAIVTAGGTVPLWSLSHLLFGDESPPPVRDEVLFVAVVKSGNRRLAVAVDAFQGRTEGILKSLGPVEPAGLRTAGGIVLGDGSVCLVLVPADLIDAASASTQVPLQAATSPPRAEPDAPACILIVDDSFTTRTLEKGILESHGYRVRVAVDGVEALQALRLEPADLIIADVQMPRMDGFALLSALKQDPALARIPVVLVTSLESPDDQERGLSLGADAYIVKRKFEQRELLETVQQLL
ncbi:MAG: hybrid sensor histidine kinase/response regulator [Candidatus Xenobia bacterium]